MRAQYSLVLYSPRLPSQPDASRHQLPLMDRYLPNSLTDFKSANASNFLRIERRHRAEERATASHIFLGDPTDEHDKMRVPHLIGLGEGNHITEC